MNVDILPSKLSTFRKSPRHLSTIPILIDREDAAKKSWSEEEIKATDLKDRQMTVDTKQVGGPLATFLFQHF